MIQKREAGLPTIPVSTDPRYGDWLLTDIFEGELYQDTNTGKWYSRSGQNIIDVAAPAGLIGKFDAIISQTGTNPPTVDTTIQDTISGSFSYNVAGIYQYDFPTAQTPGKVSVTLSDPLTANTATPANCQDANFASIYSYTDFAAGTLGNDIIVYQRLTIEIFA